METTTFHLKDGQEYIQLNNLLKILQLAQTGGHAKIIIQNGEVTVNEVTETRVRKKLYKSDTITVGGLVIKIV